MAKEMGADRVIVLNRLENRLELAEAFGADHTINIEEFNTPETRVRRVKELTDGRGADVVMDLVGRTELLAEGIDMLSNGCTIVEIGDVVRGREVSIDPSKLLQCKNIMGSLMYKPDLLPRLLNFLVLNKETLPFERTCPASSRWPRPTRPSPSASGTSASLRNDRHHSLRMHERPRERFPGPFQFELEDYSCTVPTGCAYQHHGRSDLSNHLVQVRGGYRVLNLPLTERLEVAGQEV